MTEGIEKKLRFVEEETDLVSNLPVVLQASIISFLPGTEAVKTSVLSHHWKTVWNYSSHLNFYQRQILKPFIEARIQTYNSNKRRLRLMRHKKTLFKDVSLDAILESIAEATMIINSIMDNHIGPLKSCNIRHLSKSCENGDVVQWMIKLLEKGVIKVSMELEYLVYDHQEINIHLKNKGVPFDLPYEVFTSFKVLELKNYHFTTEPSPNPRQVLSTLILMNVRIKANKFQGILSHCETLENLTLEQCDFSGDGIMIESQSLKYFRIFDMIACKIFVYSANIKVIEIGSIVCNHEDLVLNTPSLNALHAYNDMKKLEQHLTARDIIEICGGILGCQSSSMGNIFTNLITLCLDIDFTNTRNSIALSFAIKSCSQLKNLKLNNQVNMAYNGGTSDQNDNNYLPYPEVLFWQKREPCECVTYKLKYLCIKGYTGGESEFEFVKYLVLNGGVIEKIIIWFLDDCSWSEVVATMCLLSYPKLSSKLIVDLKPGVEYLEKYGSDFKKWVTTLK
ncbi:F-box protein At1g80960-like [Vicia villosa]|uniref:F-box protein At1g80960-like n=1 Tax=Vicia villosa TaxID=3911 RepID=UPI00273CC3A6|nr:F-box protein At1g80960-like [Vicia villosa]